ncbi:MAG TPA: CRISPR-associated helicase Cas3' [bacterium]|nr:CRISPR-associated helicase Cas3' [bacterium]
MADFVRLLAKSSDNPDAPLDSETLPGHTRNVLATASTLADTVGQQALSSLGLNDAFNAEFLRAALLRAAVLHDLGKANDQFQLAVRKPGTAQALRHEWVSVWLALRDDRLNRWLLADCTPVVRSAALYAALGHHLKLKDAADIAVRTAGTTARLSLNHPDFRSCLQHGEALAGLPRAPSLTSCSIDLLARPLAELRDWLRDDDWWTEKATTEEKRFVALVKALLISADVAGSAVPRSGESPERWTESAVAEACTVDMLAEVVSKRLGAHASRPFQEQVRDTPGRLTFVRAGCGSGKTLAAYMWAQKKAVGRKLFVCYPTTGTTTEGFRDYIEAADMAEHAQLKHGRSAADIELLLEDRTADVLERTKRYESLTTWHTPITLCTVDYVLGLIQNYRSALFSFPGIANGAFVFDEVHQYGDRLFAELLRFMDTFRGTPVLLMTAMLPDQRLQALRQATADSGAELQVVDGPAGLEELPRYEVAGVQTEEPWQQVDQTLARGGKVLWVANTIDRAVSFAQAANGRNPLIYHSRYRYVDRLKKHAAVMTAFDDGNPKVSLAVSTQVCEVSLDISADLLVTDMAPIPALIQRLGRLNRRASPDDPRPVCRALVLRPDNRFPYDEEEFDFATIEKWLARLAGRPVSQRDLAEAFAAEDNGVEPQPVESAWLDGGPLAYQQPAREGEGSVSVLLPEDKAACLTRSGRPDTKQVTRLAIPMPLGRVAKEVEHWDHVGSALVAPAGRIEYSEQWGGKWAKKNK